MTNAVSEPEEPTTSIELNSDTESDMKAQELTISDDLAEEKGNLFFCMARLLSNQHNITHQVSQLEALFREAEHEMYFFCLNFTVSQILLKWQVLLLLISDTLRDYSSKHYWGWAKFRYREVLKKTFEDAKNAARESLDQ